MRFFLFFTLFMSSFWLVQCGEIPSDIEAKIKTETETETTDVVQKEETPNQSPTANALPDTIHFAGGKSSNGTRATIGTIDRNVVSSEFYNYFLGIKNIVIFNVAPTNTYITYYQFQTGGTDILSSPYKGNQLIVNSSRSDIWKLGSGIQNKLNQGFSVRVIGQTGFTIEAPENAQSSNYNGTYLRIYFVSSGGPSLFFITRQFSGGTNGSLGIKASAVLRISKSLVKNADDYEIEIDGVRIDLGQKALTAEEIAQKISQVSFTQGTVYATSPYTVTATSNNVNFIRVQRGTQGNGSITIGEPNYSYE